MPASELYMNWDPVTVTPSGGTLVTLKEVMDVELDLASQQEVFYGDARKFARMIVNTAKKRSLTIMGGNVAQLMALPDDTPCTIVATLRDAKNGTGSGAITITLANATREKINVKGQNNKFGMSSLTFNAFADSGDTDPLSFAVAS